MNLLQTLFSERKPIVCECGDHAFVAVSSGLTTMVSPEDAHLLTRKWSATQQNGNRHRAVAQFRVNGKRLNVNLGRIVLGLPLIGADIVPDHINNDPLDNRRSNLRRATQSENSRNRRNRLNRELPKGVKRVARTGRYHASIGKNGVRTNLGCFATPEEAQRAYEAASRVFHGEFGRVE